MSSIRHGVVVGDWLGEKQMADLGRVDQIELRQLRSLYYGFKQVSQYLEFMLLFGARSNYKLTNWAIVRARTIGGADNFVPPHFENPICAPEKEHFY